MNSFRIQRTTKEHFCSIFKPKKRIFVLLSHIHIEAYSKQMCTYIKEIGQSDIHWIKAAPSTQIGSLWLCCFVKDVKLVLDFQKNLLLYNINIPNHLIQ